jgi:hypothetical protein
MTEGASRSLISTAILRSCFSAVKNFSAPKSALSNIFSNVKTKGSSVICQPSFSRV